MGGSRKKSRSRTGDGPEVAERRRTSMSRGEMAHRVTPLEEVLSRYEVVDLSVMDGERWPCWWPTQMPFQQKVWNWFAETGHPAPVHAYMGPVQIRWITLDDHCGTHVDAPSHFIPPRDSGLPHAGPLGSQSGEQIPLADLMGPAAVVDVMSLASAGAPGASPWITPDDLRAWEAREGLFRRGEIVLLHTGWDRYYVPWPEGRAYAYDPVVTRTGPGWPAPSAEAVEYLHARGVVTLGIDAPSVGAVHDPMTPHYAGLERGMRYVENLTALDRLPARGAYFIFLPLRVEGASGCPGRAIAVLPRERAP
jgi:isatin hydrolase